MAKERERKQKQQNKLRFVRTNDWVHCMEKCKVAQSQMQW